MPRSQWRDWRQVAETYVSERPCADPEIVVEVLVIVLRHAHSWGDLVGAASWVRFASREVYVQYVPGFRAARTYQLLDRFTCWLHARGDIDDWQRDVMRSEIDAMRGASGCAERGVPRVRELGFGFDAERIVDAWVRTPEVEPHRERARSAIRVLESQLHLQLGATDAPPLGSLSVDAMVAEVLVLSDACPAASDRVLFADLAAFYCWLAEEERLEPSRARTIAARFAAAALGLAA